MDYLKRKIDKFLDDWFVSSNKKPLIIKGARQIGKTKSIREFAKRHYENLIDINFVLNAEYRDIFDNGYDVDTISDILPPLKEVGASCSMTLMSQA